MDALKAGRIPRGLSRSWSRRPNLLRNMTRSQICFSHNSDEHNISAVQQAAAAVAVACGACLLPVKTAFNARDHLLSAPPAAKASSQARLETGHYFDFLLPRFSWCFGLFCPASTTLTFVPILHSSMGALKLRVQWMQSDIQYKR